MKKLLLLLLVIMGGVSTASADYYVFYNQDGYADGTSDRLLATLTDDDGDNIYSAIVDLKNSFSNWTSMEIQLSTSSTVNWSNNTMLWANFDINASIFSYDYFTLSDAYVKGGKLEIPIKDAGWPYTNFVRIDYNSTNNRVSATRLLEFASDNDDWVASNPVYLEETSHLSKVFTNDFALPQFTNFKYIVYNERAEAQWYGKKDSGIATDGSNMYVGAKGIYRIKADFKDNNYIAPELLKQTVSAGSFGKATIYTASDLDFSDISAISAYTITNASNGILTKNRISGKVPANVALYIEGAENASADVPVTTGASSVGDNMLVGVAENTYIKTTSPDETPTHTNYILTVNAGGTTMGTPKFYKVNSTYGNTVLAYKAYLQIPIGVGARESFWFDDETTAIDIVKQEQKYNGEVYNLAGQRITQPTKGLYIVNGKKIILK